MNLLKKYVNYIKDNPNQYWFKRKMYGWGWVPAKQQGWLVLFLWIIFFSYGIFATNHEHIARIIFIIFSIALLLLVCYKKGEKPKWVWGVEDKRN